MMRMLQRFIACALSALFVGACSTPGGIELFPEGASQEAPMRAIGGAATSGSVVVSPLRDGVVMRVSMVNLPVGKYYRVVVHANGNCSSPNGFSAGPPLILPGATQHVTADWPPVLLAQDGIFTVVLRLHGIQLTGPNGIAGKAVILHEGTGSLEAQPGVPNNRVACGIIGAPVYHLL